jgi:CheY-like chemotaxis protein
MSFRLNRSVSGSAPILSVLVVDDNVDVREGLCDFLVSEGCVVASAEDGLEALRVLRAYHPDVVVLDLRMPRMDGYEFLMRRRSDAALRQVPVIVVSATPNERKIAGPVAATLTKPVDPEQLLQVLRREIEKVRGRNPTQASALRSVPPA